jgi:hypothetical protein
MKKQQQSIAPADIKIRRKGVHAKTKTSASKTSKNYQKPYRGQGR